MDDLRNFTMWKLHEKLKLEDDEFDEWLTELGLLHGKRTCHQCGRDCGRIATDGRRYGSWRCNNRNCGRPKIGYLAGTFFAGSHLTTKQIFAMSYYWAQELGTQDQWQREFEIGSPNTVCDWRNFMRDVCAEWFVRNPVRIGGPGTVCEIDETMAVRRKYERGRLVVNDVWLFGGTERGHPERCFIVPVQRRDAATLLPLIVQHIEPGSLICSDMWRAYGGIPRLPYGYQHLSVNHQQNFVDPATGAHTQSIESLWQKMKLKAKKRFGDARSMYDTYMPEFLWRKQFGDINNVFFNFWSQVSVIYPCEPP